MPTVSQDLAPRGAPLEYWFIKLHSGDLAFLVDFIVRRATGRAEVRVSLWVRQQGRVVRRYEPSWREQGGMVAIGDDLLDLSRSTGTVEDITWDLTYQVLDGRASPRVPVLGRLHPFDLELIGRPRVVFNGHVTVAGERFAMADAPGSLTHYWGRRLPDRWHWISANTFPGTDLTVEAVAMVTRLWGRQPSMAVGYLWSYQDGRQNILISPLNGLISITGSVDNYTLVARRPGRTVRLRCEAEPDRYNDLGEGIRQTLHGSCALVERGLVERGLTDSRAGLEQRVQPSQ
jgi:Tocopherol cyclase